MPRPLPAWVALVAVLSVTPGCALTPEKPPSPASDPNLALPHCAPPGVRYYMIVFGSEALPHIPQYTHTWATVVKATEGCAGVALEADTISWLPADLKIFAIKLYPQQGVNLGLFETITYVRSNHERIAAWGPYEIRPETYHRFLVQKDFLESGAIGYQLVDTFGSSRDGSASMCIHAVTDLDPDNERSDYRLTRYGIDVTHRVVKKMFDRGKFISDERHGWVAEELGLTKCPIRFRDYRGKLGPYCDRTPDAACGFANCP